MSVWRGDSRDDFYVSRGGSTLNLPSAYIVYSLKKNICSLCPRGRPTHVVDVPRDRSYIFLVINSWGGPLHGPCWPVKSSFALKELPLSFSRSWFLPMLPGWLLSHDLISCHHLLVRGSYSRCLKVINLSHNTACHCGPSIPHESYPIFIASLTLGIIMELSLQASLKQDSALKYLWVLQRTNVNGKI